MYTFRGLECVVNKNQETRPENDADSIIEASKLAVITLENISERLEELLVRCIEVDDKAISEFPYIRDEMLALIVLTSYESKPLFDGHLDADIGLAENASQTVRIQVPDLIGHLNQYRTNYRAIVNNSIDSFAVRMRETEAAITRGTASVQGVRLNTFMPKSCRRNRFSVINSLSGLTGLHGMSYGNAIVAPMVCRNTEMPLAEGCIVINDIEVSACDGRIKSLIKSINATTGRHGVVALGRKKEKLVLIDIEGRRIKVDVLHHAGSIVSGFPCGSSRVDEMSNGLGVWLTFRHLDTISFDGQQTAKLMSGDDDPAVVMRSGLLSALRIDTPYDQRLTLYVLEVVKKIINQESKGIKNSLEQFKMLILSRQHQVDKKAALVNEQ